MPDQKEILQIHSGTPPILLLIQNCSFSSNKSGPSTFTSTWERALCLKICCYLVVTVPGSNTLFLFSVYWTAQESHP